MSSIIQFWEKIKKMIDYGKKFKKIINYEKKFKKNERVGYNPTLFVYTSIVIN